MAWKVLQKWFWLHNIPKNLWGVPSVISLDSVSVELNQERYWKNFSDKLIFQKFRGLSGFNKSISCVCLVWASHWLCIGHELYCCINFLSCKWGIYVLDYDCFNGQIKDERNFQIGSPWADNAWFRNRKSGNIATYKQVCHYKQGK